MRRILYLAFFLVACAGGQTHDPGATKGTGGVAGVAANAGSGGSAVGGSGGSTGGDTTKASGGTGGASSTTEEVKCGNEEIDDGEQCDGANFGGETCATLSEGASGRLICINCEFNTSMCFDEDTGPGYGQ
jgi:hypothetical protein